MRVKSLGENLRFPNYRRRVAFMLSLLALLLFGSAENGLAQRQRSFRILGLTVEGNKTADANFIKLSSGLSLGELVANDDVQAAIRQLWSLNMFQDVQVLLDREAGDGVYLTLKVEESPRLDKIEYDGNKKFKKKELEKEIDLFKGQVLSPGDLAKVRRKLKKFYEKKGYLLAEIEAMTEPADTGRVNLKLKFAEGSKVQIKAVTFNGNLAFNDGKLRKQMKKTKQDSWLRGGDFDEKKYREDLDHVVEFYRTQGYRDAEFLRDSVYYGADKKDMFINIAVNEGTKYYIGKITWEGNKLFPDKLLAALLGFQTGEVYSSEKLQKAVSERLGSLYYDSGYIFATVNPVEKPVDSSKVDLHFLITEGNAVTINKIRIAGNTKTKEKVIRRELYLRPGDTFSREALIRSQREVFVLNYFADVKPDVQPISDEKVDVSLEVTEKSTDTANMSAGWSERDKLIGSIGVAFNNFRGNGQKLSVDWNFGRFYKSLQLGFTEPWLFDTPTLAGVNIFDTDRDAGYGYQFGQRSRGGSIRVGRRLRWPDNYFRTDWIYRLQALEYDLSGANSEDLQYFEDIGIQDGKLTSSSITHIFSRNSLNRPEFPTAGSQVSLSTEIASGPLLGNVGYHKHILQAEWFMPTFGGLVWFTNFQIGYMDTLGGSRSQIPYLENFFMGGEGLSNSIPLRGYDDPLRNRVAGVGLTMMKVGLELRVPIAPNPTVFGLLFAEAGNTWRNFSSANPFEKTHVAHGRILGLRRSAGIGARVFMPLLGIIGFDYAYGFDNIEFDESTGRTTGRLRGAWKPHFVFGRSF
jgi:outer membrane protein insertion porin family